jgi:anti-anti-sigma regulatory factor
MSFTKIDRENVLFIRYKQETISDLEMLKRELYAEAASGKVRDTVLEFLNVSVIYSTEIGVIVQFLKMLPNTNRTLHLVVSTYVGEMLRTMNIHRIPNLAIYSGIEEVQEQLPDIDLS